MRRYALAAVERRSDERSKPAELTALLQAAERQGLAVNRCIGADDVNRAIASLGLRVCKVYGNRYVVTDRHTTDGKRYKTEREAVSAMKQLAATWLNECVTAV